MFCHKAYAYPGKGLITKRPFFMPDIRDVMGDTRQTTGRILRGFAANSVRNGSEITRLNKRGMRNNQIG
jgi:hypothetical protein